MPSDRSQTWYRRNYKIIKNIGGLSPVMLSTHRAEEQAFRELGVCLQWARVLLSLKTVKDYFLRPLPRDHNST